MNLLDTVTCDGCGKQTADPTPCGPCESFELCQSCFVEVDYCRRCARIARDEIGATW